MSEPEYDWSFLRKMSSRRFTENVIFETLYHFNNSSSPDKSVKSSSYMYINMFILLAHLSRQAHKVSL